MTPAVARLTRNRVQPASREFAATHLEVDLCERLLGAAGFCLRVRGHSGGCLPIPVGYEPREATS